MGTISTELTTFRDALDGKTGSMTSVCNTINTKLNAIMSACNAASSGVSSNYQGTAIVAATGSINSIISMCSKIESSVSSTVSSSISEAESIISDVKKLEDLNKEIDEAKSRLSSLADTDENKSTRSSLQSTINDKENEFKKLHDEALAKLTALKAKSDDSLSSTNLNGSGASESDPKKVEEIVVTGGTLQKYMYNASNGKTVSYYMYVPTTTSDTKLPVTIYFHGLWEIADKYPDRGPYGLIKSGKLQPKGIVIFPQADNGTKDKDFHDKNYEAAVMELTYKVCEEKNGDVKRLSVAGHSNGACAVGHIVANYPGVFAAAAPISGVTNVSEGMKKTNVWTFRGSYDTPDVDRVAKLIKKQGGTHARYTVFPKKGHAVQAYTFEQPLQDENGNTVYLMDWLMSKTTA